MCWHRQQRAELQAALEEAAGLKSEAGRLHQKLQACEMERDSLSAKLQVGLATLSHKRMHCAVQSVCVDFAHSAAVCPNWHGHAVHIHLHGQIALEASCRAHGVKQRWLALSVYQSDVCSRSYACCKGSEANLNPANTPFIDLDASSGLSIITLARANMHPWKSSCHFLRLERPDTAANRHPSAVCWRASTQASTGYLPTLSGAGNSRECIRS